MYKLLNKLFGWDYIHWENNADRGVARVHQSPDGTVWYWRYKITKCLDVIPGTNKVVWLTCEPTKYCDDQC